MEDNSKSTPKFRDGPINSCFNFHHFSYHQYLFHFAIFSDWTCKNLYYFSTTYWEFQVNFVIFPISDITKLKLIATSLPNYIVHLVTKSLLIATGCQISETLNFFKIVFLIGQPVVIV